MRDQYDDFVERNRIKNGCYKSKRGDVEGKFLFKRPDGELIVVVGSGLGWDRVSVSHQQRTPTWDEMCLMKRLFFEPEECVMQLHVPDEDHICNHEHCLHLWRPHDAVIPRPPGVMV